MWLIKRLCWLGLVVLSVSLLGTVLVAAQASEPTTLPPLSPEYPFEDIPNPGIPTLQEIAGSATTDAEALQMIIDYYDTHEEWLRDVLDEDDPVRLRALYAMFIVHISQIYGQAERPPSLVAYLKTVHSHCGLYSIFQAEILDVFGLPWRIFAHDGAEHAWIEVKVNGKWEVFDSTVNVWIDTDGFSLVAGAPRNFRLFYTPMNDINRPDGREHYWVGPSFNHRVGWYNMPRLRVWMTELGLSYNPPNGGPDDVAVSASRVGEGSAVNTPWLPPAS